MTGRFDGLIAVVTGATQGVGEAAVRLFAERGLAGALVTGRDVERGEQIAARLGEMGCTTVFAQADLSKADAPFALVETVDRAFGRVDVLVNAAGTTDRGGILDGTVELFDETFAVNVRAPFFLMQGMAGIMRRERIEGSIVNVGSVSAHGGQPYISAYSASKGALAVLTKNAAHALAADRIRVNQINPGWMESPGEDRIQRTFHGAGDGWAERAGAARPFGRLIQPDELARAIAFLASSESGLMTGSVVDFDQVVIGASD